MSGLESIPGLGPKTREKLSHLGINDSVDLINHFPTRYLDFSHSINIKDAIINETATFTGIVSTFQNIFTRYSKNLQKASLTDSTGRIELIWFNQPYLSKNIKIGETLSVAGTVSTFQNKKTIIAPEYGQYNTGKIIPVYPETKGLTSKWFRKIITTNIETLKQNSIDQIPGNILKQFKLSNQKDSLYQIHCPENLKKLEIARNRLAVDEIISLQAQSLLNKKEWESQKPQKILKTNKNIDHQISQFIDSLPFTLTDSQVKVWSEVKKDLLSKTKITNRLIQGDVGSGKTMIALLSCYLAHLNNTVSLFIAPTEILAEQHYKSFRQLLIETHNVPIFLLTGSSKLNLKELPSNSIIIATHAAIFQKEEFKSKLGVFIVDEQHKFGVKQRSFLSDMINPPHSLTMTATPIPRTISLTMLGNLDLSNIDTLPQNRLQIKTFLVSENKRKTDCYQWLKEHIKNTHQQAFIVCPFIDISESMASVKSAIQEYEQFSKVIFPDLKVGLLHGRLKSEEKEKIIRDFKDNKINILVTTPIIEVGVDIPNSTTIIIQSADRFGLAQLHQLRGRVGRGADQSFCYLFSDLNNEKVENRLKFLEKNSEGLKIAEYDLKNRGPGEIFSVIQHGFPSLKIANMSDAVLISQSQEILKAILEDNPFFDLTKLIKNHTKTDKLVTN